MGRQEARAPHPLMEGLRIGRAARPRDHHHEGGQVAVLAAQAVGEPGAHGRPPRLLVPGLQQGHGGIVVDGLGVHRSDEAQFVGHTGGVGQQFAEHQARSAGGLEGEGAGSDGETLLPRGHPGEPLRAADRIGQVFAETGFESGLRIEEVEVRGGTGLGQVDDPPRPGDEDSLRRRDGRPGGGRCGDRVQQRGQRGRSQRGAGLPEELPARGRESRRVWSHALLSGEGLLEVEQGGNGHGPRRQFDRVQQGVRLRLAHAHQS